LEIDLRGNIDGLGFYSQLLLEFEELFVVLLMV